MKEHEEFVHELKKNFDHSVDVIESGTLARIRQIRYAALERVDSPSRLAYWIPAGALVTACMAMVIFSLLPQQPAPIRPVIEEIEIISELELYENLEFYLWLEDQELPG